MLGIFHLFHGPLLVLAPFALPQLHRAYVDYFYFLMFLYTLTDRKCPITLLAKYDYIRQYGEPVPKYPEMAIYGWSDPMSDIFFMTTTVGYVGSLLYVLLPMDDFRVPGIISCFYLLYPKGEPIFTMVEWGTRLFMVYQLSLSLNNNSYIFMPPLAAHYICCYFHGMSSALYWTIDRIGRLSK